MINYPESSLYKLVENGGGGIPFFDPKKIPELPDNAVSEDVWFKVKDLYLRSSRLRKKGEPQKLSTPQNPHGILLNDITPSIHEISETYKEFPEFNSFPIFCHYEIISEDIKKNIIDRIEMISDVSFNDIAKITEKIMDVEKVLLIYEGRHRGVGAYLAEREFIIGRLVGEDYTSVQSQHSPEKVDYFNKPIYLVGELGLMYKNDHEV
ncbi:MAG: hypothetical protein PHT54_03210 [Candidatus Nanoarchaeia archaeon]|nr:hypothetical protein [Candidatus Nanoarchaeia archaeon]